MKFKILGFFAAVVLISACGGGSGDGSDSPEQPSFGATGGLDSYFSLNSGITTTYTDGEASIDVNTPFQRSNVTVEALEGNKLHITSALDYGDSKHAECDEIHELLIEGNSIKLKKSTTVLNWAGDEPETWTQVWEYDPPVTLIEDRTVITSGTIVTEGVNITFSGDNIFYYGDPSGARRVEFPPPTEPTNFEVKVSEGESIQLGDRNVDTYRFNIKWVYGADVRAAVDVPRYTTFEGFSILAAGFNLAKDDGIVAFGTGVIKE